MESGERDPDAHDSDRKSKDALAARGYWQAFRAARPAQRYVAGQGRESLIGFISQVSASP